MEYPAIREYLKLYPDDRLAALLAHAEDGKLAYHSCCCLVGAINADHALCGYLPGMFASAHYSVAKKVHHPLPDEAEHEFHCMGMQANAVPLDPDVIRREKIIPLIREEMARREALSATVSSELNPVPEPEPALV